MTTSSNRRAVVGHREGLVFKGDSNEMLGMGYAVVMELLDKPGATKFEPVEWSGDH